MPGYWCGNNVIKCHVNNKKMQKDFNLSQNVISFLSMTMPTYKVMALARTGSVGWLHITKSSCSESCVFFNGFNGEFSSQQTF